MRYTTTSPHCTPTNASTNVGAIELAFVGHPHSRSRVQYTGEAAEAEAAAVAAVRVVLAAAASVPLVDEPRHRVKGV